MSNTTSNLLKQKSSPCPANGRQTVGDGAPFLDSVLAVCHVQGEDDIYYYSTTFSGGPGPLIVLLSGGFDIPHEKCPPDPSGGSLGCVTGSPASSFFSSSPQSSPGQGHLYSSNLRTNYNYPLTPDSTPSEANSSFESLTLPSLVTAIPIPISKQSSRLPGHTLATPPYTPEDVDRGGLGNISAQQSSDALDFLTTLFPRSGLTALPYARRVSITSPALEAVWEGIVLELPGSTKTLYVHGKGAEHVKLRESIVALLDLADEHLECTAFVIALERSSSALGELLHSLMYVGGVVVTKPPFEVDPSFVLVGIDI